MEAFGKLEEHDIIINTIKFTAVWQVNMKYNLKYWQQEYTYNVKTGEGSQLVVSGSATSDTSAVEEVRQAIREGLKQNLKNLGINPNLRDTSASSHSVIDLVTPSNISPALSQHPSFQDHQSLWPVPLSK